MASEADIEIGNTTEPSLSNMNSDISAEAMLRVAAEQVQHEGTEQQQSTTAEQQSLNISHEIKRLQQMQQLGAPASDALLLGGATQSRNTNDAASTALLQSMFMGHTTSDDQQGQGRLQTPLFENPLIQSNLTLNPMALFGANGLLLAQNPFLQQQQQQAVGVDGEIPLPSPHALFHRDGSRRMRGGVIEPFPEKLHRMLIEVETAGRSDIISFVASGRAFAIHKPDKFFKEIVPLYFRQSRLSSFKRQLNLYGFELINSGPARGGYYHELFVKDHPELCRRMRRQAVKVASIKKDGDKGKDPTKKEEEGEKKTNGKKKGTREDDKGVAKGTV